jgi:hypothetical protein
MSTMPAQPVAKSQLKRLAGADAHKIDAALAQDGQGVAVYASYDGAVVVTVSYGNRFSDIGSRFPPSSYGEYTLRGFCPPDGTLLADQGVSPALRNREVIPQIPTRLWAEGGSQTVHPGQRTGLDSVLPVLGLEPEPTQRFVIQDERLPVEPPPPPEPPAEPKTKLTSWWSRFQTPGR